MSNVHFEPGKPGLTREGFELLISSTWGEEALAAVKDTIEPCKCGGPLCNGWRLDVDALVKAVTP